MEEFEEDFSFYDCVTCGASLLPTGHCYFCEQRDGEENCMDCGVCDACVEQSRAYYEEMEAELGS